MNSQRLVNPLMCLGDGHDGVWNLFEQIGTAWLLAGNFGLVSPEGKPVQGWGVALAIKTS